MAWMRTGRTLACICGCALGSRASCFAPSSLSRSCSREPRTARHEVGRAARTIPRQANWLVHRPRRLPHDARSAAFAFSRLREVEAQPVNLSTSATRARVASATFFSLYVHVRRCTHASAEQQFQQLDHASLREKCRTGKRTRILLKNDFYAEI